MRKEEEIALFRTSCPEVLSKSCNSISLKLPSRCPSGLRILKFRLAYSQFGYVYYSWQEEETSDELFLLKGLEPDTCYVLKLSALLSSNNSQTEDKWTEFSDISNYIRTFSEEDDLKRSGTVLQHALKMERQQRETLKNQIHRLQTMLQHSKADEENNLVAKQEDMLADRKKMEETIKNLRNDLTTQTSDLSCLTEQKRQHEQLIDSLLSEAEKLRLQCKNNNAQATVQEKEDIVRVEGLLKENQLRLQQYQEKVASSQNTIKSHEDALAKKQSEILQKEAEVERIMADCHRVMQEHSDTAHAKQMELEDELKEATTSLQRQMETNQLMREELVRLENENQQLKNQLNMQNASTI